jgi:hypothetical protein
MGLHGVHAYFIGGCSVCRQVDMQTSRCARHGRRASVLHQLLLPIHYPVAEGGLAIALTTAKPSANAHHPCPSMPSACNVGRQTPVCAVACRKSDTAGQVVCDVCVLHVVAAS